MNSIKKVHYNCARSRSVIGIGHDSVVNINKSGFQVMDLSGSVSGNGKR